MKLNHYRKPKPKDSDIWLLLLFGSIFLGLAVLSNWLCQVIDKI